ncbi:PRC-barrel domain-containing protein [Bosea sp. (in: a-proteobacteria)]|uniref:PRC-barrel domain-containing protein n=1 Tax=Bosea sp. (in: a-proteobacteria) TaxID=1871050 RepID=UPI002FC9D581
MYKRHVALTAIGGVMLAAAAVAQTTSPSTPPSPQPSAPVTTAPAAPAPAAETAKAPENNLAGQGKWRASKLMGVDIYGPDNKKVGDVTEVVFDKTGKIELVTVGVGGFLGIGSKDVAIPFDQVTWSDQPMAVAAPAPAGGTGGAMSQPATTPRAPEMYPDHGKINMSKEQLTSAPAVTYAAR